MKDGLKGINVIGVGSPTTEWGKQMIAGSGATGAGSSVWYVFPTAFDGTPIVTATSAETNEAMVVPLGSVGTGSFYVETTSASQNFTWNAMG